MVRKVTVWLYLAILLFCTVDIYVFITLKPLWGIINEMVPIPFVPITDIFLGLVAASLIAALTGFITSIKRKNHALKKKSVVIPISVLMFLSIVYSGTIIYILAMSGGSRNRYLEKMLTDMTYVLSLLPFILIILLLAFYARLSDGQRRFIKGCTACIASLAVIFLCYGRLKGVEITSGPSIQAIDDKNMAIIWSTDKKSTGYVEFGADTNNLKIASMSTNGLVDANSLTHKVVIPIEGLDKIVYRVVSTQIKHLYDGEVVYGNTAKSDFKNIENYNNNKSISFYVLNDVHELIDTYKKFLSQKNYDFAVLNGDQMNSVESRMSFFKKLILPISRFTNGEKPFVFVRGNHETRGGAAREIQDFIVLPEERFYYTFKAGPLFAVVLDLGEDKPDDGNFNKALTNFSKYKEEQTQWLKSVSQSEDYKNAAYRVAFVHTPLGYNNDASGSNDPASEAYFDIYKEEWRDLFNSTGMDIVFSGHTHVPEVIKPDSRKFSFPTIIGGSDHDEKSYVAVKTEVSPSGIKVFYENYDGSKQEVYSINKAK